VICAPSTRAATTPIGLRLCRRLVLELLDACGEPGPVGRATDEEYAPPGGWFGRLLVSTGAPVEHTNTASRAIEGSGAIVFRSSRVPGHSGSSSVDVPGSPGESPCWMPGALIGGLLAYQITPRPGPRRRRRRARRPGDRSRNREAAGARRIVDVEVRLAEARDRLDWLDRRVARSNRAANRPTTAATRPWRRRRTPACARARSRCRSRFRAGPRRPPPENPARRPPSPHRGASRC